MLLRPLAQRLAQHLPEGRLVQVQQEQQVQAWALLKVQQVRQQA